MDLSVFLKTVVTSDKGWFCLATARIENTEEATEKTWSEQFFSWPDELPKIINQVNSFDKDTEVYFSPYLFEEPKSTKKNAIVGRTIVADLDDANILTIQIDPTIIVETSQGRHQGYWVLKEELDKVEHERISRKVTYSIPRCDRNGWFLGKKVRVPGTYNNKYKETKHYIRVVSETGKRYVAGDLEQFVTPEDFLPQDKEINEDDLDWAEKALIQDIGPQEMLASIRSSIASVYMKYNIPSADRSAALWALTTALFRAGMSKEKVFYIAWHSVNNKFKDLRYGAVKALAKDVLRAEVAVSVKLPDIKDNIKHARTIGENAIERNDFIAKLVWEYLEKIGVFLHCNDGGLWYIRNDTGRPIQINSKNEALSNMLDNLFGINTAENESRFVHGRLRSKASEVPVTARVANLSHYEHSSKLFVVHTGRRDVLVVTPESITRQINGYGGLVFPWNIGNNTISPQYGGLDIPWDDIIFGGCLDNVLSIRKEAAQAVLKVWLLSVLLRDGLASRPILALFGAPGCISGDTKLKIRRGNHVRTYTIRQLYRSQNGYGNGNFDTSKPSYIRSVKDGVVQWMPIYDVVNSGKKATYTVKIAGSETFRTTTDHRFLTPMGYKKLEELCVGDIVLVEGDHITSIPKTTWWHPEVSVKYHPHGRDKYVYGFGPYKYIYRYRAVVEANMNNMSTEEFVRVVNSNERLASTLTYLDKDVVIHHKDENPLNDDYDNLEVTDKLTHDTHHGRNNVRNFGMFSGLNYVKESVIESIEYYGEEDTYDIQMENQEAPNFLINGAIVHNSGKSTMFRRIYRFLFGKERGLSTVTNEADFDHAMSHDPLVVLDNVDSMAAWLPDRLAATVAPTEIIRRKLYSDTDTITIKRDAMLGITAHNPKFGREDVTDRLILLNFERLSNFQSDSMILERIDRTRNALWGAVLKDIQTVMRTQMPSEGFPQFRIRDFAVYGYWIATALGIGSEFYEGINTIKDDQRSFNLEEDMMLLDAIDKLLDSQPIEQMHAGALWTKLSFKASDQRQFARKYGNAVSLGRKLWTLLDSLRELYDVEWSIKNTKRVWTINRKLIGSTNGTAAH